MVGITRRLRVVDDTEEEAFLRVAFATSDRQGVDQHFGSAQSFVTYGVDMDHAQLLSVCEFSDYGQDDNEDRLASKMELLDGCIAVYCRACGASAVKQLLAKGIQPVKVSEGAAISDLIYALQQELREGPSTWLAKAIQRQMSHPFSPFNERDAEGWNE